MQMEVIALTIALITTCIIACTFGALYLYKRNRSDGVLRNLTTQIENQLHPLRTDRLSHALYSVQSRPLFAFRTGGGIRIY